MKTPEFGQELEEGPILTDTAVKLCRAKGLPSVLKSDAKGVVTKCPCVTSWE